VLSRGLSQRKSFITIDDDCELVTIGLHIRGLSARGSKSGHEIKTKKQYVLQPNDLVVAELDAKSGGWGLVPASLAGAIVSSHYYVYKVHESLINLGFLDWCLRSGRPEVEIQQYVKGSTNYASIRQDHFPLCE
jgi:type I restriction enzyme S subunit